MPLQALYLASKANRLKVHLTLVVPPHLYEKSRKPPLFVPGKFHRAAEQQSSVISGNAWQQMPHPLVGPKDRSSKLASSILAHSIGFVLFLISTRHGQLFIFASREQFCSRLVHVWVQHSVYSGCGGERGRWLVIPGTLKEETGTRPRYESVFQTVPIKLVIKGDTFVKISTPHYRGRIYKRNAQRLTHLARSLRFVYPLHWLWMRMEAGTMVCKKRLRSARAFISSRSIYPRPSYAA